MDTLSCPRDQYLATSPTPLAHKGWLDALHIACAAYHEVDVLLTWNCTHIANPAKLPVMRGLCAARGYKLPELVTSFELMEDSQ